MALLIDLKLDKERCFMRNHLKGNDGVTKRLLPEQKQIDNRFQQRGMLNRLITL